MNKNIMIPFPFTEVRLKAEGMFYFYFFYIIIGVSCWFGLLMSTSQLLLLVKYM